MAFFDSLFKKKKPEKSNDTVSDKKETTETNDVSVSEDVTEEKKPIETDDTEDAEWNILPTLHAKSYYDKREFERTRIIEQMMHKYNVAIKPSKGYEI